MLGLLGFTVFRGFRFKRVVGCWRDGPNSSTLNPVEGLDLEDHGDLVNWLIRGITGVHIWT